MHRKNKDNTTQDPYVAGEPEGELEREDYAEHLAKVTPDADRNKALLQARYRALHEQPDSPHSD